VSAYLTNARTTEELIETVAAVTRGENLIPLTKQRASPLLEIGGPRRLVHILGNHRHVDGDALSVLDGPEAVSSVASIANCYRRSLRPCLGTTIAPRRRATFRQSLLS